MFSTYLLLIRALFEELSQILFLIVNKRILNKNLKEKISFFLKQVPKTVKNQISIKKGLKKNSRMILIEKKLDEEEFIEYKKKKQWIEEMVNKFTAKSIKVRNKKDLIPIFFLLVISDS